MLLLCLQIMLNVWTVGSNQKHGWICCSAPAATLHNQACLVYSSSPSGCNSKRSIGKTNSITIIIYQYIPCTQCSLIALGFDTYRTELLQGKNCLRQYIENDIQSGPDKSKEIEQPYIHLHLFRLSRSPRPLPSGYSPQSKKCTVLICVKRTV